MEVKPIQITPPENYRKVDNILSRSAQINESNIPWLKQEGVTDVVNFRTMTSPAIDFDEGEALKAYGINYHRIPSISRAPTEANVGKFLDIVENVKARNGKVHIHCKQGADRTGMYAYIYEALNKIGSHGRRMVELFKHGYHYELYPDLIDQADKFVKHFKA